MRTLQRYRRPFYLACLIHLGAAALLVLSWIPNFQLSGASPITSAETKVAPEVPIIQANAIDAAKVDAEIRRLEKVEADKQKKAKAKEKALADEKAALKKAKADQEKEKKRLASLKDEVKTLKAQAEKEKQKAKAIEKEQKALKEKVAKEKKEAEQALAALKAEQAKAKAEAAAKVAAEKAKLESERKAQQALKDALAQQKRAQEVERELQRAVSEIVTKVSQQWLRPLGTTGSLEATVRVTLLPNGEVTRAEVMRSSGDTNFDRSAEAAVIKSSPLPLPNNNTVIEKLRDFTFTFKPEGIG